jgi:hypothetical protein
MIASPDPTDVLRQKHEEIAREKVAPAERKLDASLESAERAVSDCKRTREGSRAFRLPKAR